MICYKRNKDRDSEKELPAMINDHLTMRLSRIRQREFLREAEAFRLAQQALEAQPARPGLVERIRNAVGTRLIVAGQRLTQRPALR